MKHLPLSLNAKLKIRHTAFIVALVLSVFNANSLLAANAGTCAAPTLITLGTSTGSLTIGQTTTGSATVAPTWGCATTDKFEGWYQFTAGASYTLLSFTAASSTADLQVFTGTCGSLTQTQCFTGIAAGSLVLFATTPGTVYYIRIIKPTTGTMTCNFIAYDAASCYPHTSPAFQTGNVLSSTSYPKTDGNWSAGSNGSYFYNGWAKFDITSLPLGATVQQAYLDYYVSSNNVSATSKTVAFGDLSESGLDPVTATGQQIYDTCGLVYYIAATASNNANFTTGSHVITLNTSAVGDITTSLNNQYGFFGIAFFPVAGSYSNQSIVLTGEAGGANAPELIIAYTDPCPVTQASNISTTVASPTSLNLTFTRGGGSGGVIVVARPTSTAAAVPANGTTYTANTAYASGSSTGTGNYVVYNSNSVSSGGTVSTTITGLTTNTAYSFDVYEYSTSAACYLTPALTGSGTPVGCTLPTTQASAASTSGAAPTALNVGFTRGNGDGGVIVVARTSATTAVAPVPGNTYTTTTWNTGSGTQLTGTGNYVIYNSNTPSSGTVSLTATGLSPSTAYSFDVYEYNASGQCYLSPGVTASGTTLCLPPVTQASNVTVSEATGTSLNVGWTRGSGTGGVLVIARASATTQVTPTSGTAYTANATFSSGNTTGTGNYVVYNGTGTAVTVTGLTYGASYTFDVYEYNGTTCYLIPGVSGGFTNWPASNVVFNNTGGTTQLAFNNAKINTSQPVFRLATQYGTVNLYSVEINTQPDFSGTSWVQTFSGTYTAGLTNQYDLAFTNGFTPTDASTYYVRAKASTDNGSTWSSYTSGTYSFTYTATPGNPFWYQTTQAQFQSDVLSGVTATTNAGVQLTSTTNSSANPFLNPSFESGTTSWTTAGYSSFSGNGASASWVTTSTSGTGVSAGSNCLDLTIDDGFSGNWEADDYSVAAQKVNLTGATSITFTLGYYDEPLDQFYDDESGEVEFALVIDPTNSTSNVLNGNVVYSTYFSVNGSAISSHTPITVNLAGLGYTGQNTVRLVDYVPSFFIWGDEANIYVDNISANFAPTGTLTSSTIYLNSVQNASKWNNLYWNQTQNGGTVTLSVQTYSGGAWTTAISGITSTTDGLNTYSLSALASTVDSIQVTATLATTNGAASSPQLNSWYVDEFVPTCLNGPVYTVGPTGNYSNIAAAFTALNNNLVCQNLVFELQPNYVSTSESYPLTLNALTYGSGGPFTVTFRPSASVSTALTTSGSPASAALINLNGAEYVYFDGRAGGNGTNSLWNVENTGSNSSYPTIQFINGAQYDALRYLTVLGSQVNTIGNITFSTSTATGGNSFDTIEYCNIGNYSAYPYIQVYSAGTAGNLNANNNLLNNNIYNFQSFSGTYTPSNGGVIITSTGNGSNWNISNNSVYCTGVPVYYNSLVGGIVLNAGSASTGNIVSGNYIGGQAPLCGGSPMQIPADEANGYPDFDGIFVNAGSTSAISNNTVQNIIMMSPSGSSTFCGINYAGSGAANIIGNTIGSATTASSIHSGTEGTVVGIWNQSTGAVIIGSNTVANMVSDNSSSPSSHTIGDMVGIYDYNTGSISGTSIGATTVINNQVFNLSTISPSNANSYFEMNGGSGISGQTFASSSFVLGGIYLQGTNTSAITQTVSKNTVYGLTNPSTGSGNNIYIAGITVNGNTSGTNIINGNLVYGIYVPNNYASSSSNYAVLTGLYLGPTDLGIYYIYNNMIDMGYRPTDASAVQNTVISGIWDNEDAAPSTSLKMYIYNNSVNLGGSDASGFSSYAFRRQLDWSSTVYDSVNIKNNIFVNNKSTTGAGVHYGLYINSLTDLSSNYNDIYGTGTGFEGVSVGGTNYATVSAFHTANTAYDANSISADPLFVSPTTATPDLHVQGATPINAVGTSAATPVYDYDSLVRANYTPVDIGAAATLGQVCTAPTVAPQANGIGTTATICSGSNVALTANATGGSGCSTFSEFAWTNGTNYWNGTAFGSATAVYSSSYSSITAANVTANTTYTTTVRCNGTPTCNNTGQVSVTVVAQPVAATITPNVAAGNVCSGQSLSATLTGGSGGSGTVTDVYEYSTNDGSSYSAYTSGTAINTGSLAGQTVIIRSSRTATGTGCNTSGYNTVSWSVIAQPVASTITPNVAAGNVCSGQSLSANLTGGSGGSGTVTDVYEYSTNGGSSYSAYTSGTAINTGSLAGQTVIIRSSRTATGTGCNTSGYNTVSWSVSPAATATASNTGPYLTGQIINLSSTPMGATSYSWSGPLTYSSTSQDPTIANASSSMSGNYTVTVTNSGGCTATATTNVIVNATSAYTWTGTTSTDWTDPTNWVPSSPVGGPNACAIDVIIPSVTNNPVINSAISVGNLQMNSGAQLTLNGANISVCKNLTGGTAGHAAVIGDGIVVLTGSALQTFTGYFSMQELMLSNGAGASMLTNSAVDLYTSLDLQTGNFDATNGTLTFKSNTVDSVAILDNFSQNYTGTITGNITAERYYAASQTYSQHYMGSPINSPSLVTQWGASGTPGQVTDNNCDEYQLNSNSPYGTVFQMDQHLGAACSVVEWTVLTSGNAQNGLGYSILKNGTGKVVLNGPANLDANYQISNLKNDGWSNVTQQGRPNVAGWQLLSNPYLATLELSNVPTGFDNQVQVWITNGQYEGTFQPGNIGSDAVIAPFQGFMVHKTTPGGTATYTINATDRVRTPEQFYQQNANELKILATNIATGMLDQTTVAFNSAATDTFDAQYDAQKIAGSLGRHTIYTENNNMWMARNVLHSEATTSTVPMGFEPGKTGNYSFSFGGVNTFDPTSYIYLEDRTTGQWYNVRNGNYSFNADSTDAWSRFVLHFTPPASITTVDATCNTGGTICIQQPGTANWNYTLTDNNSNVVAHGTLNQTQPVTLQAATGTYTLTLTDTNNYVAVKTIQVNGPVPVSAAFMVSADTVIPEQTVVVVANTQGAASYEWNFGNGMTGTGSQAMVSYTEPGVYVLSLLVTSDAGCSSTQTRNIIVKANGATGLNNISGTGDISIWSNTNKVYVDFTELQQVDATVAIYNILGQEISNEHYTNSNIYQKEIDGIEAAYMVVMVRTNDRISTKKVLITNPK